MTQSLVYLDGPVVRLQRVFLANEKKREFFFFFTKLWVFRLIFTSFMLKSKGVTLDTRSKMMEEYKGFAAGIDVFEIRFSNCIGCPVVAALLPSGHSNKIIFAARFGQQ